VDLLIILIFTLITFPIVILSEGTPRIILGIIFLSIFPGYSLLAALFPGKTSLRGIERAALTFVLSFAVVSLTGLALNYTPWGIRLIPICVAVAIIILITLGIAFYRRKNLPEDERFSPRINIRIPKWRSQSRFDMVLFIVLAIAVIGAITTLSYVIAKPKTEEAFTNFYILGPEGKMENYPQELSLGEQVKVTLGIENRENQDIDYSVDVMLDGENLLDIDPLTLSDGEQWQSEVALIPEKAGENQRVEFVLFKDDETIPYLTLHLWLDVNE
jgi:uncharacterized membrane protein